MWSVNNFQNVAHCLRIFYHCHYVLIMWIGRLPLQDELLSTLMYAWTWWLWATSSISWCTLSNPSATRVSPAAIWFQCLKIFYSKPQIINASLEQLLILFSGQVESCWKEKNCWTIIWGNTVYLIFIHNHYNRLNINNTYCILPWRQGFIENKQGSCER